VVILAVPPVEELDLVGPLQVFAGANRALGKQGPAYDIRVVSAGRKRIIDGVCGISLVTHGHYTKVAGRVDTLVVVGSVGSRIDEDAGLLSWLREMALGVRRLSTVCIGAFLLAEAGLLRGRRVTTHWAFAKELAEKHPEVRVDSDPIWVRDGNIYTSAGVTTGIDLALAMVEEDYGGAVALKVARYLVVFLRRPGNQAQFSVSLSAQTSDHKSLRDLQMWISENLREDLRVEALAARTAMSPRNFARVFVREFGITPAKYVEELRLEAARRQLEVAGKSLKEVALSCGFSSAETMRRAFLSMLQITPGAYRNRFRERG
jgi:transcriptional regulator GlxA family with amidase domain